MDRDTIDLLHTLATLILPVLLGAMGKWLLREYQNTPAAQQELLQAAVRIGVYAAEQLLGTAAGRDRKAYAMQAARAWLARWGYDIDDRALSEAVEAQVRAAQGWVKQLPPPAPPPKAPRG